MKFFKNDDDGKIIATEEFEKLTQKYIKLTFYFFVFVQISTIIIDRVKFIIEKQ